MLRPGYKFDQDGNIKEIDVYIVYGPPAGGKTMYVKNNMEPGDLVIDLDLIKQGLSLTTGKDYAATDNLLDVALSVREHLYQIVEKREITCRNVWVVAGLPDAEERNQLRDRLKAKLIYIEATEEQCIDRAMKDGERRDKDLQRKMVRQWFKVYYGKENF